MASRNPHLLKFWSTKARYRILYGGRSSSKSTDACIELVKLCLRSNIKVMCARQFQNSISQSVKSTIEEQILAFGKSSHFEVLNNKIICNTTGSEILFYGIQRNLREIKSINGIDILFIEEAESLTPEQWEVLYPSIRREHSEIWIIFNPLHRSDFVYRNFVLNPTKNSIVRKINYDENPFLTDTSRNDIEDTKATDEDNYRHIFLGEPKEASDNAVFQEKWILSSVDLDLSTDGINALGIDPSGEGADKNALVHRTGVVVKHIEAWVKMDTQIDSARRVWRYIQDNNVEVMYFDDGGGYGTTLNLEIKRLIKKSFTSKLRTQDVHFGGKVKDEIYKDGAIGIKPKRKRDVFGNKKAELYWTLADRFRHTYEYVQGIKNYKNNEMISLKIKDKKILHTLIDQLCSIEYKTDGAGRILMEKKDDQKKRIGKSPDLADALAISFESIGFNINAFL